MSFAASPPGDPAYDAAAAVFNLAAPARPAAAVTARTVEEVRAAVRHARAAGLPVRVHTTGHAAGGAAPMDGALLIRTALDGPVEVDVAGRVARIPAGARWGAVVEATTPHGLVPPHGSAATVGVVGYLLRGGISFYGRAVGVAANSVRAIELVTADGELRRVDAEHDPELFRALRGGGGGFGVVTAVEVALFPATTVVAGSTFWPAEHAGALLRAWQKWTLDAPREAATSFRVLNLPPVPEVPAELRNGPMIGVDGVVLATDGAERALRQTDDLLDPLRAIARPALDAWQVAAPGAVLDIHMDPADPLPFVGDHMLLRRLDDSGIDEFVRVLGAGSGSPLVMAGLRQLGGALADPGPGGGVLDRIDAHYAYSGSAAPFPPLTEEEITRHCAVVRAALAPWDTGRTAPTFVDNRAQPQGHLSAEDVAAVDRVRARVDPTGLFGSDITPGATAR
ncbi:FAD-binding oxidoreductase [Actinokineospora fastidiosa]|uniref:FAD-linked oxidase n=1 Tax=Actinokineospora fastidiosa TaxID=1816 RepID=A0A918GSL8_9PSEU|nr:FAD-binding protein [Actinokineospora fastidiosa]GGS57687.1 FAD-linked oxidase [Actinokineospora fastidiosa]